MRRSSKRTLTILSLGVLASSLWVAFVGVIAVQAVSIPAGWLWTSASFGAGLLTAAAIFQIEKRLHRLQQATASSKAASDAVRITVTRKSGSARPRAARR